MTSESSGALNIAWARLVPELLVGDIRKSLRLIATLVNDGA
jgi:hypothetical protein